MVVLDKTLTIPENPDPTWGVVKRKHTLKDFSLTFKFLLVTLVSLALVIPSPISGITIVQGRLGDIGMFFFIFFGIATLLSSCFGFVRPAEEAHYLANRRANEWDKTVLQPYLEKMYGVKFYYGITLLSYAWPTAQYEGRTVELRVHGITIGRDYTFAKDRGHKTCAISRKGIWMEEVIRPQAVTFKAMTPLV